MGMNMMVDCRFKNFFEKQLQHTPSCAKMKNRIGMINGHQKTPGIPK
jgi:hypothetical protein